MMRALRNVSFLTLALLVTAGLATSRAQDCGCAVAGCAAGACEAGGCGTGCGKVCRLVKKEKEIVTVCYGSKTKDICVPGCGSQCTNTDCVKCGKCSCDRSSGDCKLVYPTGKPGCAVLKTVNKLVKYETKKKVSVWQWEIVDADPCGGCCDAAAAACGNGCAAAAAAGCDGN